MKISDVLVKKGREVHTIDAGEPLSGAVERFGESKLRCLVVTEDGALTGMLTIRDALLHLGAVGRAGLEQPVREAMTVSPVHVAPDTTLDEAHALFADQDVNYLPVVDDGALTGLVTRADVLASRVQQAEGLNAHMYEYITGLDA